MPATLDFQPEVDFQPDLDFQPDDKPALPPIPDATAEDYAGAGFTPPAELLGKESIGPDSRSGWQRFRQGPTGHKLFGSTEIERENRPEPEVGLSDILLSPAGMPFGPGPETAAGKAIMGLFTADFARRLPDQYRAAKAAYDRQDWRALRDIAVEAGFGGAMTGIGLAHMLPHGTPEALPNAPGPFEGGSTPQESPPIAPSPTPHAEPTAVAPPIESPIAPEAMPRTMEDLLDALASGKHLARPEVRPDEAVKEIEPEHVLVKPTPLNQELPKAENLNQPEPEQPMSISSTSDEAAKMDMPAETPPEKPQGKRRFAIPDRPDGTHDILDAIQDLGGIRPPGPEAGGEYDGYSEARQGIASILFTRRAVHTPDTILGELHDTWGFQNITTPDELWEAVKTANAQREQLRTQGGGPESQAERFWAAVDNPANKSGLEPRDVGALNVGDTFRIRGKGISHEELTVTHLDPDTGEVTVKDGPKLGAQDLPDGATIWIKRGSHSKADPGTLREPPLFGKPESVEEQKARLELEAKRKAEAAQREEIARRQAKPLIGKQGDIGQGDLLGGGDLFSLREGESHMEALDRHAYHFYGRPYEKLTPFQQEQIAQAIENATVPRREPVASAAGRQPGGRKPTASVGQAPGERPSGELQRPSAAAEPQELTARDIERRAARLTLQQSSRDSQGLPASDQGKGALGVLRYMDGEDDANAFVGDLRQELSRLHEERSAWAKRQQSFKAGSGQGFGGSREAVSTFSNTRYIDGQIDAISARVQRESPTASELGVPGLKPKMGGEETGAISLPTPAELKDLLNRVTRADEVTRVIKEWSKNAREAYGFISDAARTVTHPDKLNDYTRAVLRWSGSMQKSFNRAGMIQAAIKKEVPSPLKREAITNWIQANGDAALLRQRAALSKPKFRDGYEAALNLTPEELATAQHIKAIYDAFATEARRHGVLKNLKDAYVTQIWDNLKSPSLMASARTLRDKFKFAKASTFDTYFDGEQADYVPRTKDIAKLLPIYAHEMSSTIAARELVKELSKGRAADGRPLLAPRGAAQQVASDEGERATLVFPDVARPIGRKNPIETSDYKAIENQPALHDWRWVANDTGDNPILLQSDLAVHPQFASHLKNVLGRSAIREWYSSHTSVGAEIPKLLVRGLDNFSSVTKETMLSVLSPFHQVQEATHALGHRVNPFFNLPKVDLVNNTDMLDASNHGLMLAPDRASANQFMEGLHGGGLAKFVPGLGQVSEWYNHQLFEQYIPGLKFKTYEAILARNQKLFAGRAAVEDIKLLSAQQANAAFGHLNYTYLGRNPTMMHLMRLGLLAPDFLEARMRFAGQSIKGATGARVGREQLLALATLAVGQATLAWATAQLTGGEWDPTKPFEFHKGDRTYSIRSVPEDISRMVKDARAFWYARLNPVVGRGALQYATGVDWRGRPVSASETTKELASQPIPISLRGLFGVGNTPLTGWEQLLTSAGLRISRYSAQNEVYDLADKWKEGNPNPKVRAQYEQSKTAVEPESAYKPLREALQKGDMDTARTEYQKLAQVKDPKRIDRAMEKQRPFAGSKENEAGFIRSLTPEQRRTYNAAVAEHNEQARRYQILLRTVPRSAPQQMAKP